MNIGIMGIGTYASSVARAINGMPEGFTLYAVASNSLLEAQGFAKEWNVKQVYRTYEEMLYDKEVDFVFVNTPDVEHYEHVMLCLKHNKGCLVVKPLCVNSSQTQEVLYLAEAKKIFVVEATWIRFLPYMKIIKKLLKDDVIGKPKKLITQSVFHDKEEILSGSIELLTPAAVIFGTNITSITVMSGEIVLDYADGRFAKAILLQDSTEYPVCQIYGSKGHLEISSLNASDIVRIYDLNERLMQEYTLSAQTNEYEYALKVCANALKVDAIECPEMSHTETLRMINWVDHVRLQLGLLYSFENKEDLCCYEGEGIKKMIIAPFRRYWLNCMNCIAYSLVGYGFDVPYMYYYNNNYTYGFTDETVPETGHKYQSIMPMIDSIKIIKGITTNKEKVYMYKEKNPIAYIKDAINHQKVVRLAVDLYDWIDSGLHYQKNHILHMSLVIGYDDIHKKLIVFDTGNYGFSEFHVDYDRALKAIRGNENPSSISELDRTADVHMYTLKDIVQHAEKIIDSIDTMIQKQDELWKVDYFTEEEIEDILSVLPTHMYSMQNRANMNAYIFEHVFVADQIGNISMHNSFLQLGAKYSECKNVCMKLKLKRNKFDKLNDIKKKVIDLLIKEKELWQLYISQSDLLEMKNDFIEETLN